MTYLPPQEALLPLLHLQTTLKTENVEPPKPEKPKWEEEEFPEIGKSTSVESC
jgi:hypothetical protein